jgi:hypothetical protein
MHAHEPVMLCPSSLEDATAVAELRGYKSPVVVKIRQN